MKTLHPVFEDSVLEEAIAEVQLEQVDEMEEFFATAAVAEGKLTTTLSLAVDDAGLEYRNLQFIVSGRFTRAGDTWLTGSGFEFNASDLCRRLRDVLSKQREVGGQS